jgi:hypothetical protein
MSDEDSISIKITAEQHQAIKDTNISTELFEDLVKRHKDLVEESIQRDAVVSDREVPFSNGYVVVWGEWS